MDDIFDKLDDYRVSYLINMIENQKLGQTFITDTNLNKVPEILSNMNVNYKAFKINSGSSKEIK